MANARRPLNLPGDILQGPAYAVLDGFRLLQGGLSTSAKLSIIPFDARWSPARVEAETRCTIRAVFGSLRLVR